jgi:diguanylate cyclase (GGDEF)-like protein/PAS domain S-box-containing protein
MHQNFKTLSALQTLFDNLSDAVYLIDPQSSNILWANQQAWQMLGMQAEEILDHSVLSLQKDVHGLPQWSQIAQIIAAESCFRFNGRHLHKQGYEIEVEVNTSHFQFEGKQYFLSIARDITTRVQKENELLDKEKQTLLAIYESSDGSWDWTIASEKVVFSNQLKRLLGYGPEEMGDELKVWKSNIHPQDAPLVLRKLEEHLSGKRSRYEAEYRLRNRNGHYIWINDRGKVCERDAQGKPLRVVGIVHDITNQKYNEQHLQKLASYDALTGLINRREGTQRLKDQIELACRLGVPLGIAYMDIDHFKRVNDIHGHEAGDKVLQRVAQVLQNAVRRSDIICRWGGEEFILIANQTPLGAMQELSEKVRRAIQKDQELSKLPITMSLGITIVENSESIALVLARADAALYNAKHNGRNRVESVIDKTD